MKRCRAIIILLISSLSFGQGVTYEKAKIINRIPVKDALGETFQLYLPNSYNPDVLSAIVFIFDPSGNGTNGINTFRAAAEKFNYVLVCSNNTKNGPYQQNFDITNRLFSHVFSNFNIDEKQIYAAGFSGGSRLACTVAVLTGAIQGVIACGAGFPIEMDKKPSLVSQFSYVGLVGDEDMNYQEMFNVKEWLNTFKIDNALFTYEDLHRWPPEIQINRAFMWLEIQAYNRKIRESNTKHIDEFYAEDKAYADSLSEAQPARAVMDYERIKRHYASYKTLDVISDRIRKLKKSKAYKNDVKIRENIVNEEYKQSEKLLNQFRQEVSYGESRDNFAWWQKALKKLDDQYLSSNNNFTMKMGRRLQFRIWAAAHEGSMIQRNARRLDRAIYCDKLLTYIRPSEPYTYYRLAETYAMNNDAKNARLNLQKAVEKGFQEYSYIFGNPEFKKFKGNKKFNTFLQTLN